MKKLSKVLLALLLTVGLVGCGGKGSSDDSVLKISATNKPHAEVLEQVKPILKEKHGIDLQIKVIDEYFIFNEALDSGDSDANYFQHRPFFEKEVKEKGYNIVEAAGIHLEPFGFYSQTLKDIKDLPNDAKIIISNSIADHGRILGILEKAGLIEIDDKVDILNATTKDITSNPKNLQFEEIKPEMLPSAYKNNEGSMVAINGNYALAAGLSALEDAILLEEVDANNPYVNIVACQKGHENDKKIKALIEVLKSDEIKSFIKDQYKGSVVVVD